MTLMYQVRRLLIAAREAACGCAGTAVDQGGVPLLHADAVIRYASSEYESRLPRDAARSAA